MKIKNINTPKKAGLAIRRLRKEIHLTQSELAKKMNMRQPTISDIESGKGTLESFFRIIQALKLNLEVSSAGSASEETKTKGQTKLTTMLSYLDEV